MISFLVEASSFLVYNQERINKKHNKMMKIDMIIIKKTTNDIVIKLNI